MPKVALILLAAGSSKRLGQPKQLLKFRGRTLLQHAVETAIQSSCRPVIVVANEYDLNDYDVIVAKNPNASEGIASSIRAGIDAVPESSIGAVIMLVDQPFVTAKLLDELASSASIAAAKYNDSLGVPAFFPRQYFPELLELKGDRGAKSILQKHNATAIDFPGAAIDIDTAADANELTQISPFP